MEDYVKQVAVLIDGDNISDKYAEYIRQEARQYGKVKILRLYGSVNSPSVKRWYRVMPKYGISPVLQICYVHGKSVADQALTIDAMDILHMEKIDVFCIVSSDSDYTKLVYRIREAGKTVIGMGEQKTKEALANACDEFKILDLIYKDESAQEEPVAEEKEEPVAAEVYDESEEEEEPAEEEVEEPEIQIPEEEEIVASISAMLDSVADDNAMVNLAEVGKMLKQKYLGFDARNYGYRNMTQLIRSHEDVFLWDRVTAPDGIHHIVNVGKKQ